MAGDGLSVRGKGIAALGVIVAVVLGVLLTFGLLGRGGGTAQAAGEIYLAPAASTGPNPFTASLMTQAPAPLPATPPPAVEATPPIAPQAAVPPVSGAVPPPPPTAAAASPANAPATALTSVDASVPQLYGGRMGVSPCDAHLLVRQLDGDGDVARAWSRSEGIDLDSVHDFVAELVPVDLLDDVQVTDWRRVDGHGVAFQAVLERGTTVLVDRFGLPRVRCLSGDPLNLPDKVQRSARFVGERWERFQPAAVIVIVPAPKVLPTLVLLETSSGQPFGRPVGGGRPDIDTQVLVADQQRLGVVVNLPPDRSPDAVQDIRLSPWGGPPGSVVLAFGTGWPAGDRIRIEPCVGGRPETCALRTDAAVFLVVDGDGGFRAAELRVPGDVRLSDYVEFYVQDLRDDHRERTFDSPWRVAAAECRDGCGDPSGCHPPYCDAGDQHGCRCLVRTDPVCEFDSCDRCPKDRCTTRLREEPTPTPRPQSSSSTGSGHQSQALQSVHGVTAQQFAGQSTHSTSSTTATTAGGSQTQQGQGTTTHTQSTQSTHTASQSTQTTQSTHSQTTQPAPAKPTPSPTPAPAKPTPTPTAAPPKPTPNPTPPPAPPKPTPSPTPAPPKPTPNPTPAPTPPPKPAPTPAPQPRQSPAPTPPPPHGGGSPAPTGR